MNPTGSLPPSGSVRGIPASISQLQHNINSFKSKLKDINTIYLESINQKVFGGSQSDMDVLQYFTPGASMNINTVTSHVNVLNKSSYTAYNITSLYSLNSDLLSNILEVDCRNLLNASESNIANTIQSLYMLHSILHADYYDVFVKCMQENTECPPLYIPSPLSSAGAQQPRIDVSSQIPQLDSSILYDLINIPHFNAFVARRIVYLWILMYNFVIACAYNNTNSNAASLVNACYSALVNNYNILDSDMKAIMATSPNTITDIKYNTNNNALIYRKNQNDINSLAPIVDKNKKILTGNKAQLNARHNQSERLKVYKYTALAILLFITAFAFFIIVIPLDNFMKIVLTCVLVLISVCNVYLLQYLFETQTMLENFVAPVSSSGSTGPAARPTGPAARPTGPAARPTGPAARVAGPAAQDPLQNSINTPVIMNNVITTATEYLNQTEQINLLLQSNNIYSNTNDSLNKEIDYYNDVTSQLSNKSHVVHSVYKSEFINQIRYVAAIQLFISLTIIVAAFTLAYVVLELFDITGSAYIWISCITGACIIISLILYFLEVNIRVRTDPKQIYWGKPARDLNK
jgi:hypothetical protein